MKRCVFTYALIALLAVVGAGCGGDSAEESESGSSQAEDTAAGAAAGAPKNLEEAMKAATEAMGNVETVEPVDFRELKELLPEDLVGLDRTNATGQKSGAMGMKVSMAEGQYRDGPKNLTVTITDLGTLKGMAMMSYAAWLNMEFDRETDTGYERTTKYEGYPAFEKFQRNPNPNGELAIVVGQRFIVNVKGRNVEMDGIKKALEAIDLDKLEGMKTVGVK